MKRGTYCIPLLLAMALLLGGTSQAATGAAAASVAQGDQQWRAGQLAEAQKSFEQALAAEPRSVDIHLKLAGLLLSGNDFSACIPLYQKAISLDASNVRAWLGLGFSYLHTGKDSLSLAAFQEALRLDPGKRSALQPLLEKLQSP